VLILNMHVGSLYDVLNIRRVLLNIHVSSSRYVLIVNIHVGSLYDVLNIQRVLLNIHVSSL